MTKVICHAKAIPDIGWNCFSEISGDAVLYVYRDVLEDYKNSDWVQYFSEILPIDEAGIDDVFESNSNGSYKVFNLNGINVLNTKYKYDIENLPSGLYIINGKKVMIGK